MSARKYVKYAWFAVAALFAAGSMRAQFMPLEARIRETNHTLQGGKIVKSEIREGVYYRSSDGSTLTKWLTVNGEKTSAAELFDNSDQASYQIDYSQGRAFKLESPSATHVPVRPGGWRSISKDVGSDSVEGLRCRILPVKVSSGGTISDAGKSCVSQEYGLILWSELTTHGQGNNVLQSRTEMYGFKLGTEPDRKLFDISGFTIFKGQPPAKSNAPSS